MSRKFFFIMMLCMSGLPFLAQAQTVTINSNASFASDGTFTLSGAATAFNDLVVNPAIGKLGATAPEWVDFNTTFSALAFDAARDEFVTFTIQMPHDYKEGSDIYAHVHWTSQTAAGTNRVTWKLDYAWANLSSALTTTGNLSASEITTGAAHSMIAYEHVITPLGTISGTGKTLSSIITCRLTRVGSGGSDSYGADADLLSFDLHYEADAFGSSSEYTK